jgi:hypothetical protein
MSDRQPMDPFDWLIASLLAAVGLFLGIAVHFMTQLSEAAFWPVAIISFVLFFGIVAFHRILLRVAERIFSGKIRAGRHTKPRGKKPLALLLAVPVGLVGGMVVGWLGLGDEILGALP